jgi:hypothetical protein
MRNTTRTLLTVGIAGAMVGLGSAPAFAAVDNDLQVYSADVATGAANGFVGKGTYKNGARVWTHLQVKFSQSCLKEVGGTKTRVPRTVQVTRQAVVNATKEVTHADRLNSRNKITGYTWKVDGLRVQSPTDLCAGSGFLVDPLDSAVDVESNTAEAYLSSDGGVTTMLSTFDQAPIVKSLW